MDLPDQRHTSSSPPRLLEQDLSGKVALVTGATRGIGRAIALHLASRGASILATSSSPNSLHLIESLATEVGELYEDSGYLRPRVVGVAANLLSPDFADTIAEEIHDTFNNKVHIIINNAAYSEMRPMGELDASYIHDMLLGNVQSLVLLIEALFTRECIQPFSRIINISGAVSRCSLPTPGMIIYAAVKSAMESLTRSWADILSTDERTQGTTSNSLLVGPTASESFLERGAPQFRTQTLTNVNKPSTHKSIGWPNDIADVVGLLVSRRSHWINGSTIGADGGMYKVL
ncbi:3-oxoacyl-(acyl-carrier-protein) reductase [Colletotrichum truncatum]|uniref:3-oxoacyl-(Acyl-carrier-protein) reductase n=1 Tax=Colletotrichum truncatum TaxID=5467 RepID=A0ACC3YSP0_COLTU